MPTAYLDAVDDEGVAAEHPLQRPGLGVEGARAGVPAAGEHCEHSAPLGRPPEPRTSPRTPRGRSPEGREGRAPSPEAAAASGAA